MGLFDLFRAQKLRMPTADEALPGNERVMPLLPAHRVYGTPLDGEFPGMERALFGLGCFWGAEIGRAHV